VNSGDKAAEVRTTTVVLLSYVAAAVAVLQHLWADPQGRMFADNGQDHIFFEWVLTHAARLFTHGDNPFFTDQLNAPLGINLMANTSVLGLALPLAPITLLFGAGATLVLIDTIALAGTAAAWYLILSRHVVTSRVAAYIGALFCGFAPSMISQSTGHPNIAGQFLIPFIVWGVLRLRDPGPTLRRGIVLGALVLYQCFLNEEILFLTAVALFVFLVAYLRPRDYRPVLRNALPALGVGALFAGVLLAYPLYHQFFGPQAYHGLPEFVHGFSTDAASFTEFSRRSIFAPELAKIDKMGGPTEENTFFGWPLISLLAATFIALFHLRAARALIFTAAVFASLSLGTMIKWKGEETKTRGPWWWVHQLPLFDSVVPTRLALVITPLVGIMLAMLVDRYVMGPTAAPVTEAADGGPEDLVPSGAPRRSGEELSADTPDSPAMSESSESAVGVKTDTRPDPDETTPAARWLWAAAVLTALIPLIPTPQPADPRSPLPIFFSSGAWRETIPVDSTVVPMPLGWWEGLDGMRWATQTNLDIHIAGGYFLAPNPDDPKGAAMFGPAGRPSMQILNSVAGDGSVPQITPDQQAQARADVAYWDADFLVLPDQHGNSEAIRQTADQLFGPGQHIQDVWIWKV
jgi:hypothetical protein